MRQSLLGSESISGPQCPFLSQRFINTRRTYIPKFCQEPFSEGIPPTPILIRASVVDQGPGRARVALAFCSKIDSGWVAQPPFFLQMVRNNSLWLADSFASPAIRKPSSLQILAGKRAMAKILEDPRCQNPPLWGSDQWFSYQEVSAANENIE